MQGTASHLPADAATRPGFALTGWAIVGWSSAAVVAVELAILWFAGTGEEGVRMAVRATARTSLVLFGLAFVASSWFRLRPGRFGAWLLSNRRYLGLSFASSHAIHLAGILVLAFAFDQSFPAATVLVGGFAYVLIFAMAATSFDRTAAWIGPRAWRRLHGLGARTIWFVFFVSYLPGRRSGALSLGAFVLVVTLAAVRTAALWKIRRGAARAAAR